MKFINTARLDPIGETNQYVVTRKVILNGEVDECAAKDLSDKLLLLSELEPKEGVTLLIDSYGGDVYSGLYLYDLLKAFKFDITTIVFGKAMSAAFLVALAGTRGKRYITPNATMMQHEMSAGAIGKLSEMEGEVEECKRLEKVCDSIIKKETSCPKELIKEFKRKDYYFTPKMALKYKIVDKIIRKIP